MYTKLQRSNTSFYYPDDGLSSWRRATEVSRWFQGFDAGVRRRVGHATSVVATSGCGDAGCTRKSTYTLVVTEIERCTLNRVLFPRPVRDSMSPTCNYHRDCCSVACVCRPHNLRPPFATFPILSPFPFLSGHYEHLTNFFPLKITPKRILPEFFILFFFRSLHNFSSLLSPLSSFLLRSLFYRVTTNNLTNFFPLKIPPKRIIPEFSILLFFGSLQNSHPPLSLFFLRSPLYRIIRNI